MKNIPLLIATILGTVVLVAIIAIVFSNSNSQKQAVDQAVLLEGATHVVGPENAKVTIVEFSDFQCPACRAVEPLLAQVRAQYPNDVRFVYRHFPLLQIHPFAELAARASVVAANHDKFWEMHDWLFANQDTWAGAGSQDEAQEIITAAAEQLGLDKMAFTEEIQSDTVKSTVAADMALGTQLGVNSTPTIYVNGQKLSAPQQLPQLVAEILNQ